MEEPRELSLSLKADITGGPIGQTEMLDHLNQLRELSRYLGAALAIPSVDIPKGTLYVKSSEVNNAWVCIQHNLNKLDKLVRTDYPSKYPVSISRYKEDYLRVKVIDILSKAIDDIMDDIRGDIQKQLEQYSITKKD